MESLQTYLPLRVASNVDFGAQPRRRLGGRAGGFGAGKAGAIARWNRFRERWFVAESRGALVLLALWPAALLFPASVPLGLGQVLERAEEALADWLDDTPFLQWVPMREVELEPLLPGAELLCVMLGALIPCLLAYSVSPHGAPPGGAGLDGHRCGRGRLGAVGRAQSTGRSTPGPG